MIYRFKDMYLLSANEECSVVAICSGLVAAVLVAAVLVAVVLSVETHIKKLKFSINHFRNLTFVSNESLLCSCSVEMNFKYSYLPYSGLVCFDTKGSSFNSRRSS